MEYTDEEMQERVRIVKEVVTPETDELNERLFGLQWEMAGLAVEKKAIEARLDVLEEQFDELMQPIVDKYFSSDEAAA